MSDDKHKCPYCGSTSFYYVHYEEGYPAGRFLFWRYKERKPALVLYCTFCSGKHNVEPGTLRIGQRT